MFVWPITTVGGHRVLAGGGGLVGWLVVVDMMHGGGLQTGS